MEGGVGGWVSAGIKATVRNYMCSAPNARKPKQWTEHNTATAAKAAADLPPLSLLKLLQGDVEIERLVAVVKRQAHEGMSALSVLNLDNKIAAAVRDSLHCSILHLTHRKQLAVSSEREPGGSTWRGGGKGARWSGGEAEWQRNGNGVGCGCAPVCR